MQASTGGFTDGIEAINVCSAGIVSDNATTGVVGSRNDRNRVFRDINTQLQAAFVDCREMLANKLCRLM